MTSPFKILIFYFGVLATIAPSLQSICAQELFVVKKPKIYLEEIKNDSNLLMIEVKSLIPTIVYDLRYSTSNNFTKERLYKEGDKTYLRRPVAGALADVQNELKALGYGLKIFDAYRPYKVTEKIWSLVGDERFAADPKKGSNHNRGIAVDLTIIDLKTNKEQETLNWETGTIETFSVKGRHDLCIALRVPPVLEAVAAVVLADLMLLEGKLTRIAR